MPQTTNSQLEHFERSALIRRYLASVKRNRRLWEAKVEAKQAWEESEKDMQHKLHELTHGLGMLSKGHGLTSQECVNYIRYLGDVYKITLRGSIRRCELIEIEDFG